MKPTGGVTLIIHTIIILVNWIRKNPVQFFIVLSTTIVLALSAVFILFKSLETNNNYLLLKPEFHCPENNYISDDVKKVVLRLDDVQAYSWRDISIKMVNEGISRGLTFTLSVIPIGLHEDTVIVDFLDKNKCKVEIAQHGWNNRTDTPEFYGLSELAAHEKIKDGKKALEDVTKEQIVTFVPPDDVFSSGTARALEKEGFERISSGGGNSYFDYSASTYNFAFHELNKVDDVLRVCEESVVEKGFCIIVLHPQDYSDEAGNLDETKYSQYTILLDKLQSEGFSFTTIKDLSDPLEG